MANSFYWDGSTGSCQYGARYAVMTEKPVITGLTYDTCIYDEAENAYTKKVGAESSALTAEERSAIIEFIKNAVATLPYQEAYVKTVAQNLTEEEKDQVAKNVGLRRVHATGTITNPNHGYMGHWVQYEDGTQTIEANIPINCDCTWLGMGTLYTTQEFIEVLFPVPFVKWIGATSEMGNSMIMTTVTSSDTPNLSLLVRGWSVSRIKTGARLFIRAFGTWK